MARRIVDEFEDLNTEAPDQDLDADLDEDESDEIFSETTEGMHELDENEVLELQREYQEKLAALQEKAGIPTKKAGKGSSKKGGAASKDEFEWKPANTLDAPEPRPGMVQRWVRFMVGADQDPKNWSRSTREGWKPRSVDTVTTSFNAPTMNHGTLGTVIQVGDVILCEMDERLYKSRKKFFRAKALRQKEAMEKRPMQGTDIKVEERKATVTFGRRRARATED
jgi:hypothetical protein